MAQNQSVDPIVNHDSKVLVLGAMPEIESCKTRQYYADSRNAFWSIMGELYGAGPTLPYELRCTILLSAGVALWNSLSTCIVPGGRGTSTNDEESNNFTEFFAAYRKITHVFFNGTDAHSAFVRLVSPSLPSARVDLTLLPSTSHAHSTMSFGEKVAAWLAVKVASERP